MTQRVNILGIGVLVLALGFYYSYNWILKEKPISIKSYDKKIEVLNEQLITAQILANNLDHVYTLFERNLALSEQDSLADDASIPFLNSLTQTIDSLGIQLRNIRPKQGTPRRRSIETPYDIEIRCNYRQFGKLLAELERSSRLITVKEFHVKNGVERLKNSAGPGILKTQDIEMQISTLTLVKE
ncbi:MAG: type 4a pilus biogenesis protein PilO [Candidatus Marinimicrobia bacterium]|nr:type 4a pilus biogenesis protein PilO [Candidatus Neomarinimicrobiota bacterium]